LKEQDRLASGWEQAREDTQERETRSTSYENTVRTCSWKAWLSIPREREREGVGEKAAADEGIRGRKENSRTKINQKRRWRW
jgi:hypothetical protein